MFLGWTSQITALLDKKEATAVHKIIENIAYHYPQALVYPFKMSYEGFKFDKNSKVEKEFAQK
jgi:DNA-dependent protein kinase catalytic subunit